MRDEPHAIRAARILGDKEIVIPILVGTGPEIECAAADADNALTGLTVVDPSQHEHRNRHAESLWARRQRRGVTHAEARRRLIQP